MALPIALTIFDVILLNESLDYRADRAAAKTNLVVRLGRGAAAHLYVVVGIGTWFALVLTLGQGVAEHDQLNFQRYLAPDYRRLLSTLFRVAWPAHASVRTQATAKLKLAFS